MAWEEVVCPFLMALGRWDVFQDALGHGPWKGSLAPHNHCLAGLREKGPNRAVGHLRMELMHVNTWRRQIPVPVTRK